MGIQYRGYTIQDCPKPIPSRAFDWEWVHEGYDGDHRWGNAATLKDAKQAIDEQIEENRRDGR